MFLIPRLKSSAQWGGLCPDTGQPALSLLDSPTCLSTGVQNVEFPSPGLGVQLGLIVTLLREGLCAHGKQEKCWVRQQHLRIHPSPAASYLSPFPRPGETVSHLSSLNTQEGSFIFSPSVHPYFHVSMHPRIHPPTHPNLHCQSRGR